MADHPRGGVRYTRGHGARLCSLRDAAALQRGELAIALAGAEPVQRRTPIWIRRSKSAQEIGLSAAGQALRAVSRQAEPGSAGVREEVRRWGNLMAERSHLRQEPFKGFSGENGPHSRRRLQRSDPHQPGSLRDQSQPGGGVCRTARRRLLAAPAVPAAQVRRMLA